MAVTDRSFRALIRYPWLVLLPLGRDLVRIGLGYAGLPTGQTTPELTLVGQPATSASARGFLPSALPSVADLKLAVAPALQTPLLQAPVWAALVVMLLLPALDALVYSLFLGLLADAVTDRPLSARRALHSWPAFFALDLATRLAFLTLPLPVLIVGGMLAIICFPALPFAIGVVGLPLVEAVKAAPWLLWGRFRRWFGLGLLTMFLLFGATLVWSGLGSSSHAALLLYPVLATWLVGCAVGVVATDAEPDAAPEPVLVREWVIGLVALAVCGGAWLGATWMGAWQGWYPSREEAIGPAQRPIVLQVANVAGGELVLSREGEQVLSLTPLRRSRFGWQRITKVIFPADMRAVAPATAQTINTPFGPWYLAGELFDQRVAYIQIGSQRYPVGQSGPVFLLPMAGPPDGLPVPLDAAGAPLPDREVKKP